VARDSNTTLNQAKKKAGSIVKDPFRERIEDLITSWDLVDIKLIGSEFTKTNKRLGLGHSYQTRQIPSS
jgi:hypothetical protein